MPAARFTVSTREWDERSYVQGLLMFSNGTTLVVEADPTAAGETFEVHARDAAGKYLGKARAGHGHGSNVGLEETSATSANLWYGNVKAKATGYAPYRIGKTGTLSFTKVPGLPYGDVSIDQAADLLCVRTGNRYRGYQLAAAKAGSLLEVFDFTVPAWGNRWQGMLVVGGRLFVHRDLATKSTSRAHVLDYRGRPVTVRTVKGVDYNWLDTTRMGDEAEGFVHRDGTVYAVKRTGNTGPSRLIVATPLQVPLQPPPDPALIPGGTWEVVADKLAAVDHDYGDKRDPVTYVRDRGYRITTGVDFVTATDSQGRPHVYLLTDAGYRYAVSSGPDRTGDPYLRKVGN